MLGGIRAAVATVAAIVTFGMAATAPQARASAGDLDPTFSTDGKVSLVSAGPFVARAVAVLPDGKIVVGGYSCAPGDSRNGLCQADGDSSFRIARFTPDGGLDPEWGDGGVVTTTVGSGRSQIFDLLVQSDGRVVAGGVARDAQGRDTFAMARYDSRGGLDTGFGSSGTVFTPVGVGFSAIADLAPGPGDAIVAVGQARDDASRDRIAVARYGADGRLDGSFGAFGTALAGDFGYGYGLGAWVTPSGGIVAAGIAGASAGDAAGYRTGVVSLTGGGGPDSAFGGDGDADYGVGTSSSFANAMAGLPDGRWLTAGAATDSEGRQVMAIVRGYADGRLDTGWDGDGIALVRTLGGAVANDLVRLPDGRVIAVGQAASGDGSYVYALARLTDAGQLDPSFGAGVVTTSWTRFAVARATAAAVDADGRVLAAGIGCLDGEGAQCDKGTAHLTLARYLGDPPPPPPSSPADTRTAPLPVPSADTRAPAVRISRLPGRVSRRSFARLGLLVKVTPDEEATITAGLRRRSGRRTLLLTRRTLRYATGTRAFRLLPSRKRLPHARRYTVTVELRVTDRAGNVAVIRRSVRVR